MHFVDDCPGLDLLRYHFSREEWALLPTCVRAHGLVPADLSTLSIPVRYAGRPAALAADVQHTLIDM